jgi:hypothetical protein
MRAAAREDDQVGSLLLELVVVPGGPFGALVLGVPHLGRSALERLRHRRDVEHQLDHLPVGLVLVVPVVERVVEPVLEGELARLGDDVGIRSGGLAAEDLVGPLLVTAAGIERRAGRSRYV